MQNLGGYTLIIANTLFQQHKRKLYTWASPDGQHRNQIDYILCSQGGRSSIQSAKTRLGADCSSDHELLIAKFRLKLKKVGKNTRPFRYDLNQIPYDYIVEEAQAGFKIAGRNIHNLRYADDTTLMAECEEELKSLLMTVKEESGKSWLKAQHSENEDHGIWSHHFMGNRWGNSGNSVRRYFLGSKITADGD